MTDQAPLVQQSVSSSDPDVVGRQWPDNICSGPISYGYASNYDGFYLADCQHGIPTFGSVAPVDGGVRVNIFNYPGQTEAIAKQLVDRWNCYDEHQTTIAALRDEVERYREAAKGQLVVVNTARSLQQAAEVRAEAAKREILAHMNENANLVARVSVLETALKQARKRIEYYGASGHRRHFDHDMAEIFPVIDAALSLPVKDAGNTISDGFRKAVSNLVIAARTSGGVAGRDEALCQACEAVEAFFANRTALSLPIAERASRKVIGDILSWHIAGTLSTQQAIQSVLDHNAASETIPPSTSARVPGREELIDLVREFICEFWIDKPQMRWKHIVLEDGLSMIAHSGDTICFGDPNHKHPSDAARFDLIAKLANATPALLRALSLLNGGGTDRSEG